MQRDARSFLFDISRAIQAIERFVSGKTFDDYLADELLRAGVERELIIVGEAISQLLQMDSSYEVRIPDAVRIISFRNILVHGYAIIQHQLVWSIVEDELAVLRSRVSDLMDQAGSPP